MADARVLLRHTLATLAYRSGKTLRDAPAEFATFKAGPSTRTPVEVLAHMGDLLDWALWMAQGVQRWNDSPPLPWEREVERYFAALAAFDHFLGSAAPLGCPLEKLFQGPIADALTHTGQLAMLRRLQGAAIRGESYARAEITVGRVGAEQAPPRKEFD